MMFWQSHFELKARLRARFLVTLIWAVHHELPLALIKQQPVRSATFNGIKRATRSSHVHAQ